MIRKCETCKQEFTTSPSRVKKGSGRFCSRKCYEKWYSVNLLGERNKQYKSGDRSRTCIVCGEIFKIHNYTSKNKNRGLFCSLPCLGKWRAKNLSRENSPLWRGGLTPKCQEIRTSQKYFTWRDSVFKRDNFTCQKCHKRGVKIHAHHLKKFSVILNDIRQKFPLLSIIDIAGSYPDLWKIKNGVTLCEKCHKLEHKKS
jgi:5-methylcytosine-specific restriction endonuclease McrA